MYEFDEEDRDRLNRSGLKKHGPKSERRPKKRADGEGTVFAVERTRKDGSPSVYYWAAKTVALGATSKKVTAQGLTERAAIDRRDSKILKLRVIYGLEPPESIPPDPRIAYLTVGDCLTEWLDERRNEGLAPNSIHMYDARIRNHLLPAFGAHPIRLLTYDQLKVFFGTTLPAKGLGPDSIRQVFICLRSAIDHYLRDGKLLTHPMVGLKPPTKDRKSNEKTKNIRRASKFLWKYLGNAARREDQEARWFLGMMGMRQGEVLGLTDDCLDGARPKDRGRRVLVKQQLQRISAEHGCTLDKTTGRWSCGRQTTNCPQRIGETRWELTRTKTESSFREIVIHEEAWQMLLDHRKRQQARRKLASFHPAEGKGLDTLLFARPDGQPIYAQRDRKALDELLASIQGLPPDMTVHTLRHIATTLLIEGGATQADLVSMMGWSANNADAQIATYSSADVAGLAAGTSMKYAEQFFPKS
ncbi:integrase-like protein [Curtobacterium sp. PhB130]|uniref:tyrosine-type recombinase/integrase n=1 Tax=Curtobacterium sp. PhB130 TaxID=2485178 RepID=UPI000F4B9713|nr:tyrosine-type recombinase/integrase [Curtobacterium sp. PhB130]ROS77936.1 integrase-like protein [Curtobacterium sp. PhB130]